MPWSITDILEATGGTLVSGKKSPFRGFFIDSRTVSNDSAFVAIRGKKHDGHTFVDDVIKNGCPGIIACSDSIEKLKGLIKDDPETVLISVKDTTEALSDLARFQRKRSNIKVIAVTGSSGKTSTRSMTARIMSGVFSTLATAGNFNNDIGLPLTMFRLSPSHEWAVLELGASAPGEIASLAEICRPDIAIITNIGPAHLEGFGSIEGVASAKSELISSLDQTGIGILNADDPFLKKLAKETKKRIITYGTGDDCDIRGSLIETHSDRIIFDIFMPDSKARIEMMTPGPFMMMNALAAAAACLAAGVPVLKICEGLEDFRPEKGRLAIRKTKNGASLIDDTYNANPSSMLAAIGTLVSVKGKGRAILVCGDMLELGEKSAELHEGIGKAAAENDLDALFVCGSFSENVKAGALKGGMPAKNVHTGEKEVLARLINDSTGPGDWVLVKGSRSMKMEEIVESLGNKNEKAEERVEK